MTYRLIIRDQAETDMTQAAIWYNNQLLGLGKEFIAEVDNAITDILANPRQFPRLRRKPEVRRVLVKRFPYRIFFYPAPRRRRHFPRPPRRAP